MRKRTEVYFLYFVAAVHKDSSAKTECINMHLNCFETLVWSWALWLYSPTCLTKSKVPQHSVPSIMLHLIPANPIIAIDISTTNPPLPRERAPAMQDSPIVKYQHSPRHQLLPVLILPLLQQPIKNARRIIPLLHLRNGHINTRAVSTIPAHPQNLARRRVLFNNREATVGLDADPIVARGMRVDSDFTKRLVRLAMGFAKFRDSFEAVY